MQNNEKFLENSREITTSKHKTYELIDFREDKYCENIDKHYTYIISKDKPAHRAMLALRIKRLDHFFFGGGVARYQYNLTTYQLLLWPYQSHS